MVKKKTAKRSKTIRGHDRNTKSHDKHIKGHDTGKHRRRSVISLVSSYKKGLLEVDKEEDKYDKLFEQKLAAQYREFRNLKEHHMQLKKFIRITVVLIVIVLVALLLISFRV
jgi:hypothetical protein